jgi:hypothetical protein
MSSGPYATCGFGSPGAMKFVSQFPAAFAAEHRAIVGELSPVSIFIKTFESSRLTSGK